MESPESSKRATCVFFFASTFLATAPSATPQDHHHAPSDGLSSLAEASALVEPAGPAEEMIARPSDHPMYAAPSQTSNKRKRGQREPQSRGSNNSDGGTSRSLPSGQSANSTTVIRASRPLPKLKGRGRPRCKRAEARLLHADEPLMSQRAQGNQCGGRRRPHLSAEDWAGC